MRSKNLVTFLVMACLIVGLTGCMSFQIGTRTRPVREANPDVVQGVLTANFIPPYEGDIIKIGWLEYAKNPNELISVDVYPIFGFAIGAVGVRLRVIPIDFGIGILGYEPYPTIELEPAVVPVPVVVPARVSPPPADAPVVP